MDRQIGVPPSSQDVLVGQPPPPGFFKLREPGEEDLAGVSQTLEADAHLVQLGTIEVLDRIPAPATNAAAGAAKQFGGERKEGPVGGVRGPKAESGHSQQAGDQAATSLGGELPGKPAQGLLARPTQGSQHAGDARRLFGVRRHPKPTRSKNDVLIAQFTQGTPEPGQVPSQSVRDLEPGGQKNKAEAEPEQGDAQVVERSG